MKKDMNREEKSPNKTKRAGVVQEYVQWLKLEKSLSPNTVEAYQQDLQKLLYFLDSEGVDFLEVTNDDLERFNAGLHDIGIHARSQARILSGIKSFYRFLVLADYLEADPSELLEGPKIGFKLPEVLTVEEIDAIIDAIGSVGAALGIGPLISCLTPSMFLIFSLNMKNDMKVSRSM